MELPKVIKINEVVLRDGLQLEKKILSVEEKTLLFNELQVAGVKSFEFGSFVHPKRVPQMATSGELFTNITNGNEDADLIALVPNLKGVEIAKSFAVKQVNFVFSASDTHNLQNVQSTTQESLEELRLIDNFCKVNDMLLDVTIATTFGCPFEGDISIERILTILESLSHFTVNNLTLADTTGMANPLQVHELLNEVFAAQPDLDVSLHFHNTRGLGLANILAAIQSGVTSFDTALGGLGGCPFAPGATGNVCTEDVVHMLHSMNIETTIDLDRLLEVSRLLERIIEHPNSGYIVKAGPYNRRYSIPSV
ncbi:hydroxymethylglutaryl-CoA lyase [Sporosarcina sp. P13]|uniref:hydroxymethylglutaryl-CoA lyase n=1 Tax=Sporosarcina sp. P13 TaxID=2048263 RepID=UPI000C162E4D|nr:hydroxymethylglutaryl-CoA lyase [Sporosarcina sp. P13]PIC64912.1 hydroxymethylglutaryl-CoA lyase [Sporosarcina sp. P13]